MKIFDFLSGNKKDDTNDKVEKLVKKINEQEEEIKSLKQQIANIQHADNNDATETAKSSSEITTNRSEATNKVKEDNCSPEEAKKRQFICQMDSFIASHGTEKTDVNALLDYASKKLNAGFNYGDVTWTAQTDFIKVRYEWAAHSFFDDGGGEEGCLDWSFRFVGNDKKEYCFQNEKLMDMNAYKVNRVRPFVEETFYVQNPFGFNGVFEVRFHGYRRLTD